MNIFKVLASGRSSFKEETASAIVSWFLNPTMEHGLGCLVLSEFIEELSKVDSRRADFRELSSKLTPRLRTDYETQLNFWCNLEYNVGGAFIDIVLGIEDWLIAIENKIYSGSVTDGQLKTQYEGLREKHKEKKICSVYLVPIEEDSEVLDARTQKVFDELDCLREDDFKAVVTWQKNSIGNTPSISSIIQRVLDQENRGIIDPVSEYTRHTLKALYSFISNDFSGYEYERTVMPSSSLNSVTEKQVKIDKLQILKEGCVGVRGGIRGLLQMEEGKIRTHRFQYTSQDVSNKPNWLKIETFNKVAKWILDGETPEIEWNGRFSSLVLYRIARDYKGKVFIGIKGGQKALESMTADDIMGKQWQISTMKASTQWVAGDVFWAVIQNKSVYS